MIGQVASSCNGDIRSAIHSLQFLELRVPGDEKKGRGRKKLSKSHDNTKSVAIGVHDAMLTLFHVIGKILYTKSEFRSRRFLVIILQNNRTDDFIVRMGRKP